jgi:NADH-quinone oxidoreductase subunit K
MIPLSYYLVLAAVLFCISLMGIALHRNNLLKVLMCIELMLLAVNLNFITFAHYLHLAEGEVFVFFVLTVAAAESAIGLAMMVLLFRKKGKLAVSELAELKG